MVTSSKFKTKEYKRYLPNIKICQGNEIAEVLGSRLDVIIYKSLAQDINTLVDDTIIEIWNGTDWEEVVDVKWNLKALKAGKRARWITSIAKRNNNSIEIYEGIIEGKLCKPTDDGAIWDSTFIPQGSTLSMSQLGDLKEIYDARFHAVQNLINKKCIKKIMIEDIDEWVGQYQNDMVA